MKGGNFEKLKRNKRKIPFEIDDLFPNFIDKGLVMKANCDVDDDHVLFANCYGDWVFHSVHSYNICRDKKFCLQG